MTNVAEPVSRRPSATDFYSHYPRQAGPAADDIDIAACENVLTEWFERPVLLLSSGRAALSMALALNGCNRYEHRIRVPRFLSRCVVNAITTRAFPVEPPAAADGTLLYHQYGFPQRARPDALVTEDIAHAFYASAASGSRGWHGDVAVFSLKKFFPVRGMAGGLVVHRADLLERARERLALAAQGHDHIRAWIREVVHGAYNTRPGDADTALLDGAYELLLSLIRPDAASLAGFPRSLRDLQRIGAQRQERVVLFRQILGRGVPESFWHADEMLLPFALPYFGRGDRDALQRADRAICDEGVFAGIYRVDIRRTQEQPEYRPCLLLPAHQDIPLERFEHFCRVVRAHCPC